MAQRVPYKLSGIEQGCAELVSLMLYASGPSGLSFSTFCCSAYALTFQGHTRSDPCPGHDSKKSS